MRKRKKEEERRSIRNRRRALVTHETLTASVKEVIRRDIALRVLEKTSGGQESYCGKVNFIKKSDT